MAALGIVEPIAKSANRRCWPSPQFGNCSGATDGDRSRPRAGTATPSIWAADLHWERITAAVGNKKTPCMIPSLAWSAQGISPAASTLVGVGRGRQVAKVSLRVMTRL
jgi:hypothetical protein